MEILLVQPSPDTQKAFGAIVEESLHELATADSAARAIARIREAPPDVVVLDMALGMALVRDVALEQRALDDGREALLVGSAKDMVDLPDYVSDVLLTPLKADDLAVRLALVERRLLARLHTPREQLLATAVECAGDIVEITDDTATFEYVNPAFERIMGYTREEAVGKTPKMLIRSNMHQPEFFREIERSLAEGRTWSGLVVSAARDGRLVYLEGTLSPVRNRQGVVTHHIGVKRDVTERIRTDQELRRTNEQLERARDAALEASRAKSQFLANMSHELRTPLNAIIGYSEMLAEESEDLNEPGFVSDLNKITTAARHLLSLINDVLDFSKIEAGGMELFVETFAVSDVLDTVRSTMGRLVEDRGNDLVFEIDEDIGSMTSDITKLRQTLLNLLGNANKFTENGTVTVRGRRHDRDGRDWISFAIEDTGIGMSDEQVQKLFRPFSQADASTTRKYGGTGLGLTICKHFCQMMEGHLEVTSEPGHGSTFTVHLPAMASEPQSRRDKERAEGHGTGRVLIIDDDPSVRDLLSRTLGRRGFTVSTAEDGVSGIDRARTIRPDVIVLDVLMPGIDGWHVIAELKRMPETADIPVVMLTLVDQANVGFSLGAADFILKPIVPDRIAQVVGRHCIRELGRVLVVEDDPYTADLVQRTLERDGYQVDVAGNGRIALEILERARPDAIVLDLLMPEVDGFTFLEEMRKLDAGGIPVIVTTAKELTGEERATLEARVQQIIKKGDYAGDRLLEAVSRSVADAARKDIETSARR